MSDETKRTKQLIIGQLVDFIVETYKPHDQACFLGWRELLNAKHASGKQEFPWHNRDTRAIHEHYKSYGKEVNRSLAKRYGLTVVGVNSKIRTLVKHGHSPDRSTRKTDERYLGCRPSSHNPTAGIVVFPKDQNQDHPLILGYIKTRVDDVESRATNTANYIDAAANHGVLSKERGEEEIKGLSKRVVDATTQKYPLFPIQSLPEPEPKSEGEPEPEPKTEGEDDGQSGSNR